MVLEIRHVGTAGAAAIRNRSMMVRLGLMGVIALLLWRPGNWAFAGLWWAVYAALQVATAYANHRRPAWGMRPLYLLSFVSFCVAGFPTWHLWTHVGVLGVAAASLFCVLSITQVAPAIAAATAIQGRIS